MIAAVDYLAELGRTFGVPAGGAWRDALVAGFDAIGDHERVSHGSSRSGRAAGAAAVGSCRPGPAAERTPTFAVRRAIRIE
jgi:hypothetical protein